MMAEDPGRAETPIDLSSLDPLANEDGLERHVRAVRAAASAELLRRQSLLGIGDLLVRWRRPILAASALLAVASVAAALSARQRQVTSVDGLAVALGVPVEWVTWAYAQGQPPTTEPLEPDGSRR